MRRSVYEDSFQYGVPADQGNLRGMSGSPFLNEDGEVVGVIKSNIENIPYLLMVKLEHVKKFIDGNLGVGCSDLRHLESCILKGALKTKELAEGGDAIAQYQIGYGGARHVVLENPLLALGWLEKSAKAGFAPAQVELASKYYYGSDANIQQNFRLAFSWYKRAADQNDILSQRMVGYMYYSGEGTERNPELAAHWLQKAVNEGDVRSEKFLKKHMPNQVKRDAYARTILKEELTLLEEKLKEKMRSRFPGCVGSYDPCGVLIEGLMEGLHKGL